MASVYFPDLQSLFLSSLPSTSWFHLLPLLLEIDCHLLGKGGWIFVICFYSTLWNGDGISRDFWSTDNESDRLRYGGAVNQQWAIHIPSVRLPSLHHELLPGFRQLEQSGNSPGQVVQPGPALGTGKGRSRLGQVIAPRGLEEKERQGQKIDMALQPLHIGKF